MKSFSLAILVSLTNILKIHWGVKIKHILQLFNVRHFLETRLTFDLFLSFSFTFMFKKIHFEFPRNWTLWVLVLRKCFTLTKARSCFLEMPRGLNCKLFGKMVWAKSRRKHSLQASKRPSSVSRLPMV